MFKRTALALALSLTTTAASAQLLANNSLSVRIDTLQKQADANPFEIGMLQSLRAIENSLQTRYTYGIGDQMWGSMLMRSPARGLANPAPQQWQDDTFTGLFETLLADLDAARATLAQVEGDEIEPFELKLNDIWFDMNSNGQREANESAVDVLQPLFQSRSQRRAQRGQETPEITVRFDRADHAWLTAYTHAISGTTNLLLAFDPGPVWADLYAQKDVLRNAPEIPNTYDIAALQARLVELEALKTTLDEQSKAQREDSRAANDKRRELRAIDTKSMTPEELTAHEAALADLKATMDASNEARRAISAQTRPLRSEIRAIQSKLPMTERQRQRSMAMQIESQMGTIDTIYSLLAAFRQAPDKAHIAATNEHWKAMIAHNRRFWADLALETDDENEWVPNPAQTSALGLQVPAQTAEAWQAILADAEAVLDGRLLVPHPLLPEGYGINIAAYMEEPSGLDIIDWVHGIGAYKYAAKGPRLTAQNWAAFQRLTGGNAGGFAMFFN